MTKELKQGKTSSRREFSTAALAGLSVLAMRMASAAEAEAISPEQALKALDPWADALFSGDPAKVQEVLAPEYQIVRSDGTGYDKQSYMKTLPKQKVRSKFSEIVATGAGEIMVLRYRIETDQVIEGKEVKGLGPRLSVFRRDGERWLMSAHANFSAMM